MHKPAGQGTRFETALTLALILVLAWAPFPYGSNRPWASSLLALLVGGLLLAWAGASVIGRARLTGLTQKLRLPALCAIGAVSWALFQTVDLGFVDRVLGMHVLVPWLAHPVWTLAAGALGAETGAYVSVDPARLSARAYRRGPPLTPKTPSYRELNRGIR